MPAVNSTYWIECPSDFTCGEGLHCERPLSRESDGSLIALSEPYLCVPIGTSLNVAGDLVPSRGGLIYHLLVLFLGLCSIYVGLHILALLYRWGKACLRDVRIDRAPAVVAVGQAFQRARASLRRPARGGAARGGAVVMNGVANGADGKLTEVTMAE
jgi:hypothetical protein